MDRIGDAGLGIDDGDVDVAVNFRPGRRLGDDFERDAGVFRAEIAQDWNGEAVSERGRQRDLEHALRAPPLLDHLAERLVDTVEGLRNDRQDVPPRLGEHQLLGAPLEQRDAEKILEHDHVAADRALRDRQAIGRSGEAEMLSGRFERSERVERQPLAIHSSSARVAFVSQALLRARQYQVHTPSRTDRTIWLGRTIQSSIKALLDRTERRRASALEAAPQPEANELFPLRLIRTK